MTETVKTITKKIHWFVIPLLISFLTWVTVMIYSVDTNVKVIQKESSERANMQEKIYETSREARTFAIENNSILVQKAEKSDLEKIDFRLTKIETRVNQIWNKSNYGYNNDNVPYKDSSFLWTHNDKNNDLTYASGKETK